jgi:hypothetical protein
MHISGQKWIQLVKGLACCLCSTAIDFTCSFRSVATIRFIISVPWPAKRRLGPRRQRRLPQPLAPSWFIFLFYTDDILIGHQKIYPLPWPARKGAVD